MGGVTLGVRRSDAGGDASGLDVGTGDGLDAFDGGAGGVTFGVGRPDAGGDATALAVCVGDGDGLDAASISDAPVTTIRLRQISISSPSSAGPPLASDPP